MLGKAHLTKFPRQRWGIKETEERFTGPSYAGRNRIKGQTIEEIEGGAWDCVVKSHAVLWTERSDPAQRLQNRLLSQVRHDPKPGKERGIVRFEACRGKAVCKRMRFKVNRGESKGLRNGNSAGFQAFPFPGLRGGKIDFENLQISVGIAISKGIETGAQNDILADSARPRLAQMVFSKAAARGHKRAQ